mgnify:CR=1 FL=1
MDQMNSLDYHLFGCKETRIDLSELARRIAYTPVE